MAGTARFLSGNEVWTRIKNGVKTGPSHIAVAWWCTGMSDRLPLRKGSVLVVRADRATMEQGQTNPWELEKLAKRGARIFSLSNLHAKVFVFADSVVIGSMNASAVSWQGRILEAAVEATSTAVVGAARAQVLRWALDKPLGTRDFDELKILPTPTWRTWRGTSRRQEGESSEPPIIDLPPLEILRTETGKWKRHSDERYQRCTPVPEGGISSW